MSPLILMWLHMAAPWSRHVRSFINPNNNSLVCVSSLCHLSNRGRLCTPAGPPFALPHQIYHIVRDWGAGTSLILSCMHILSNKATSDSKHYSFGAQHRRRCETKAMGRKGPSEDACQSLLRLYRDDILLLTQINTHSSIARLLGYGFPCRFGILCSYVAVFGMIRVILEDSL